MNMMRGLKLGMIGTQAEENEDGEYSFEDRGLVQKSVGVKIAEEEFEKPPPRRNQFSKSASPIKTFEGKIDLSQRNEKISVKQNSDGETFENLGASVGIPTHNQTSMNSGLKSLSSIRTVSMPKQEFNDLGESFRNLKLNQTSYISPIKTNNRTSNSSKKVNNNGLASLTLRKQSFDNPGESFGTLTSDPRNEYPRGKKDFILKNMTRNRSAEKQAKTNLEESTSFPLIANKNIKREKTVDFDNLQSEPVDQFKYANYFNMLSFWLEKVKTNDEEIIALINIIDVNILNQHLKAKLTDTEIFSPQSRSIVAQFSALIIII